MINNLMNRKTKRMTKAEEDDDDDDL